MADLLEYIDDNKQKLKTADYLELMRILSLIYGSRLPLSPLADKENDDECSNSYDDDYLDNYT